MSHAANDLLPRPAPVLQLGVALRCLTARYTEDALGRVTGIRCGPLSISGAAPLQSLCRRLVEAGRPDSALQVRYRDRSPAVLVVSIHTTAAAGCRDGPLL